jgi:hypothetical protein
VRVVGTKSANSDILQEAALEIDRTLQDESYLETCVKNGLERMGRSGGSIKIANYLAKYLLIVDN